MRSRSMATSRTASTSPLIRTAETSRRSARAGSSLARGVSGSWATLGATIAHNVARGCGFHFLSAEEDLSTELEGGPRWPALRTPENQAYLLGAGLHLLHVGARCLDAVDGVLCVARCLLGIAYGALEPAAVEVGGV